MMWRLPQEKIELLRFLPFYIVCFLIVISCSKETEREFYPSGKLYKEVPLKNGNRDGKLIEYFESGKLSGYWTWVDGKMNGKSEIYFENGKLSQENNFINGVRCCESRFYAEDGHLIEIQYIDKFGRVIDYKKFKKNGERRFGSDDSIPLVISKSDTIELGDYYEAEIRLGNRKWDSIRVVLGKWDDYQSLFSKSLPSIDSVTSFVRITPDIEGKNTIEGTIIEVNTVHTDSAIMHPFRIFFFATNKRSKSI